MQTSQNNAKCFCYYARSVVNISNIKGFFDVLSLRGLKRMFHYWNIGLSEVKKNNWKFSIFLTWNQQVNENKGTNIQ